MLASSRSLGAMEPSIDGGELFPVPLHSDFGPSNYRPYVLDLVGAGLLDPGAPNVMALVVLTRQTGLLLALPELALSAEDRESGELASATDLLGPSIIVEVQAAALDEDALQQPPQVIEGKVLKVALVDFSVEVSNFITELVVKEDIAELTPFDFMDFSLIPDPDSLVARAQEWARGGGDVVLERIQYYFADEVPETTAAPPRPATRRRGPGAGTTGGGQPPSRRKPTVASLAESLEAITTTLPAITASLQELRERTEAIEAQRPLDRPSALRRPLGASAMPGSSDLSTPAAQLLKEMPRPKSSASNAKSPHVTFSEGEAQEMSLEIPSEPRGLSQSHVGPVAGTHDSGVSPHSHLIRPLSRLELSLDLLVHKGSSEPGKITGRTCCAERDILCQCFATDGSEDAASSCSRSRHADFEKQGHYSDAVLGEAWGLWTLPGHWSHHLAGCSGPQPHDGGQSPSCKGCPEFVVRVPGADCYGQWEHAGGPPVVIDGGPTPGTVHQQVGDVSSPASTICPHGSPTLGHNGVAILEGDGCHLDPQVGSGCSSDWSTSHQQQQQQRPTSNHCSAEKEAKGKGRWKGPERPTDKHTTRGRAVAGDDARLEEEVSIAQILSALPRWILRTRTPFAAFLARSFHIKRCGSSPASAVFPVPAPHLGLFDAQATSRLSARKWTRLCLQRALRVVVMALNYIHSGNAFVPISALGRRPKKAESGLF